MIDELERLQEYFDLEQFAKFVKTELRQQEDWFEQEARNNFQFIDNLQFEMDAE